MRDYLAATVAFIQDASPGAVTEILEIEAAFGVTIPKELLR